MLAGMARCRISGRSADDRLNETIPETGRTAHGFGAETTFATAELRFSENVCTLGDLPRSAADLARCTTSTMAAVTPPINLRHILLAGSLFFHTCICVSIQRIWYLKPIHKRLILSRYFGLKRAWYSR